MIRPMRPLMVTVLAASALLASACGSKSVTIQGALIDPYPRPSTGCLGADSLNGSWRALTFRNESGTVIGRVTSGPPTVKVTGESCVWSSNFTVTLPKATFYQARADNGVEWAPIGMKALADSAFRWTLNIEQHLP